MSTNQNYKISNQELNKLYQPILIYYIRPQTIDKKYDSNKTQSGQIPTFTFDNNTLDSLIQYHFMPKGDRTGPNGDGPRTGRGEGNCSEDEKTEITIKKNKKSYSGKERGTRLGTNRGTGLGRNRN